VLALAAAPRGFTVAELTAKVQQMTGQTSYTIRQAAYDLRKLRGKHLIAKPGKSRRYLVPPTAARTIAALLALRDQVIGPILAGVRSPRLGRKPAHWTAIDRDYETPPHRHAGPLPRPRHRGWHRSSIDNLLSIRIPQAARERES
jgi:hypothetical protein